MKFAQIIFFPALLLGFMPSGKAATIFEWGREDWAANTTITWVFSGVASGTLGGVEFADTEIVITSQSYVGETNVEREFDLATFHLLRSLPRIEILGVGTADWLAGDAIVRRFGPIGAESLFLVSDSDTLLFPGRRGAYDPSVGPPFDPSVGLLINPTFADPVPPQFHGPIPTDRGDLDLSLVEPLGYTVTYSTIPEPSVAILGAAALLGIAVVRRRKR